MTKNKDQIVFVNQSSGYLMIDIIRAHDGLYDEYALLAGSIHSRNNKLPEHIKIDYLVKYNRKSKFKRLLSWVIGFIQILWIIKTRYRNAFLFIVTNPPLAVFIPFFCKNKYSILFYDIFPDGDLRCCGSCYPCLCLLPGHQRPSRAVQDMVSDGYCRNRGNDRTLLPADRKYQPDLRLPRTDSQFLLRRLYRQPRP